MLEDSVIDEAVVDRAFARHRGNLDYFMSNLEEIRDKYGGGYVIIFDCAVQHSFKARCDKDIDRAMRKICPNIPNEKKNGMLVRYVEASDENNIC